MIRVVALALLLSGCFAHMQPLNTPSGKPQVYIAGVTAQTVIDDLVNNVMTAGSGAYVQEATDRRVVFVREETGMGAAMLYGSSYDATPQSRLIFTVTPYQDGVNVFANGFMVTNPGTAFERSTDVMYGKDARDIQAALEAIKSRLEVIKVASDPPPGLQPE